jgi:hypothetical protein
MVNRRLDYPAIRAIALRPDGSTGGHLTEQQKNTP